VVRPADANETTVCWRTILEHADRPAGLVLTRQNVPTLERGPNAYASGDGTARGAYILADTDASPDVILIATGSEVQIALDARHLLTNDRSVRVVSMPCREWFAAQPDAAGQRAAAVSSDRPRGTLLLSAASSSSRPVICRTRRTGTDRSTTLRRMPTASAVRYPREEGIDTAGVAEPDAAEVHEHQTGGGVADQPMQRLP
jgi:transketolase